MDTYDSSLAPRFSQLLAQREAELRAVLHANDHLPDEASGVDSGEVVDFKDVAAQQSRAAVAEAKVDHAANELELVLAAQRRLADGSYGRCLDCGEAIDLRRLTALPASPCCTACQAIHEHERPPATRRRSLYPQVS
ncbi:TraR/DksA family transcriptional regulator [Polaromonas sp. P1(28)-13]|nr:TraR/DksA family transcriptional regulator [Polaromonas sp. P1(28)-13]